MSVIERIVAHVAPRGMRLPIAHFLYSHSNRCEPEIRHLARLVDPACDALDIGANIGVYAYRLSRLAAHVHAFEPHPRTRAVLAAARLANVSVHACALSSRAGTARFYVPRSGGNPMFGWSSLVSGRCPGATDEIVLEVRTATLDSFGLRRVGFMKMDVEGHELEVLAGAERTLTANRPTLLMEVDADHRAGVNAFLERLGYRRRSFEEVAGAAGSPANVLYLPD